MKCQRCNLPIIDGPASYAGPQCKCWAYYNPAPHAAPNPGCQPALPLTEADVRRIIREEMDARLRNVDLTAGIRFGGSAG